MSWVSVIWNREDSLSCAVVFTFFVKQLLLRVSHCLCKAFLYKVAFIASVDKVTAKLLSRWRKALSFVISR